MALLAGGIHFAYTFYIWDIYSNGFKIYNVSSKVFKQRLDDSQTQILLGLDKLKHVLLIIC